PQILYLLSRNVTLVEGGFAWHKDRFFFGSGLGNAGNPGNPALREQFPVFEELWFQPAAQALYWLLGLLVILYFVQKERRAQSLAMVGFYFFCGLSLTAKGIPGVGLPGAVALLFLIGSRNWKLLTEGRLRVALGALIVLVVGMPWYVAVYIRHGAAFIDRFLIHDHINRLTTGVHGDTGSVEYFMEQLGFATFPWIAFAPLAIAAWAFYTRGSLGALEERHRSDVATLLGLWGTGAFVLFSAMTTKFHHYIFPAVPPTSVLVGLALDSLLGESQEHTLRGKLGTFLAFFAPIPFAFGIGGRWGDLRGKAPPELPASALRDWVSEHPLPIEWTIVGVVLSVLIFGIAYRSLRPQPLDQKEPSFPLLVIPSAPANAAFVASLALLTMVGRDLSWVTESRPYGYERLIHLFVYNYQRAWPEQFDYRPILTGLSIAAALLVGLAILPIFREIAIRGLFGVAFTLAVWGLDVYLPDLAPHWGQRSLFEAYYKKRRGPEERLIAWQMNWKGENFYTGNACYIFVDLDTRPLQEWVARHEGERHFFVLEPSRLGYLRSILRDSEVLRETTTYENNHFMLASAILGRKGEAARRFRLERGIPEPEPWQRE
ncbi:MAG: hypothetical protein NZM37_06180, partial [Sandaracinaceae bacterium]|nr:hypothetical protein [Sandaracinaceae bacterium]